MERKWQIILALAGGIIIGMNWGKIKKVANPMLKKIGEKSVDGCASIIRFFAEQKERLEDQRASSRTRATAYATIRKK